MPISSIDPSMFPKKLDSAEAIVKWINSHFDLLKFKAQERKEDLLLECSTEFGDFLVPWMRAESGVLIIQAVDPNDTEKLTYLVGTPAKFCFKLAFVKPAEPSSEKKETTVTLFREPEPGGVEFKK